MVCQTPDTELTAVDGLYTMVIHGVSSDMTGTIKCTAYNKVQSVTEILFYFCTYKTVFNTFSTEIIHFLGVYFFIIKAWFSFFKSISFQAGECTTTGPLKVVAPVPVEFETSLCDATCREGDTLKLKVSIYNTVGQFV